MQKINFILPALFLTSFYLNAATGTPANGTSVAVTQDIASAPSAAPVTAGQDQIVRALQDDILFEREKRQLSNELALEKLRAELLKVRGDSTPVSRMPATPPAAMPVQQSRPIARVSPASPPSVVLVSLVAGVSRVAVSVNGQMRFISRHETFTANGKTYRLEPTKNKQLVAREVK